MPIASVLPGATASFENAGIGLLPWTWSVVGVKPGAKRREPSAKTCSVPMK